MSWDARDNAKIRRGKRLPAQEENHGMGQVEASDVPPWKRTETPNRSQIAAPEQIPTMAHEGWWLGDRENDGDYDLETLREMNMQGMMSRKQWDRWAKLCTRGIPSY